MSISGRLERFVRSLIDDKPSGDRPFDRSRFGGYALDSDYADAMNELEYFIETGFDPAPGESNRSDTRSSSSHTGRQRTRSGGVSDDDPPPAIKRAFRALEVEPGAAIDDVIRSYKRLVSEYHPDKHAWNAQRAEAANEVTKRLNLAYRAVHDYYRISGRIKP